MSTIWIVGKLVILTLMLAFLPLVGACLAGLPTERYMKFLPEARYLQHGPFSWPVFAFATCFVLVVVSPFIILFARNHGSVKPVRPNPSRFPWWGWIGLVGGMTAWGLSWTRPPWFHYLQGFTFVLLWLCYIITISALTYRRRSRCIMLDRPIHFLLLFPISTYFWWFFEYLNRFVENWSYSIVAIDDVWGYVLYGITPFSTILPAVLCTQEWMSTFPRFTESFRNVWAIRIRWPRLLATSIFMLSFLGLGLLSVLPDYLFPLLFLAPLFIIIPLQVIFGERHIFSGLARGDWRLVCTFSMAALFCGFFWEMWNYFSLARWEYDIPFINRFHLFEMPVLGFSGYLPFGLECAVVIQLFKEDILNLTLP